VTFSGLAKCAITYTATLDVSILGVAFKLYRAGKARAMHHEVTSSRKIKKANVRKRY
jgi:hypothetical protein